MTPSGPPPPFPDPAAGQHPGAPGTIPPGPRADGPAGEQPYGSAPLPPAGADQSFGTQPSGAQPSRAQPSRAQSYGPSPYGRSPYGEPAYGASPYGQSPYDPPSSVGPSPGGASPGGPAPAEQLFGQQPHGPQFAQPPAGWSQPTNADHAPDQPFDPSIPGYTLSSDQFRPPRDRKPLWIIGIVVAVVALVVATSSVVAWRSDQQQQQQQTAPPSAPATIPTPSGNGIDFDYSDGAGRMEIVDSRWTSDRLEVQVRITVTRGQVQYGLYNFTAFDEQGTTIDPSTSDVPVPALGEGTVTAGQTTEGWLALQLQRQDVTLLLVSQYGKAITAYLIKG